MAGTITQMARTILPGGVPGGADATSSSSDC